MKLVIIASVCVLLAISVQSHLLRTPGHFVNPHLRPSPLHDSCPTTFTLGGAKYDVSVMQLPLGGYIANNTIDQYYYCLNICANVNSERNCVCNPCGDAQYPSQQIRGGSFSNSVCQAYLGQLSASKWSLLDTKNPSAGLLLVYSNGQVNATRNEAIARTTRLSLICDPTAPWPQEKPQFVGENPARTYSFTWRVAEACPL